MKARWAVVMLAGFLMAGCASTPRVGERTAKGSIGDPVDQRLLGAALEDALSSLTLKGRVTGALAVQVVSDAPDFDAAHRVRAAALRLLSAQGLSVVTSDQADTVLVLIPAVYGVELFSSNSLFVSRKKRRAMVEVEARLQRKADGQGVFAQRVSGQAHIQTRRVLGLFQSLSEGR